MSTLRLDPDDDRWLALWERSPQRSPFSHPAFARALAEAFGLRAHVLAVEADDGALTAGTLVFEKRRGPFTASALPPLCPVHTPLLARAVPEADTHARRSPLDALLGGLAETVDQATFALAPSLPDLRPFAWAGWTATPRYSYHLRLGGDLRAGYSRSTRHRVRRHRPEYEVVEDAAYAEASVRMMADAYRRGGSDLGLDTDAVVRLAEAVAEVGHARTFAALRDGTPEAALTIPTDGRLAVNWMTGSVPGPAMTVLLDAVFHRCADAGVETFDLGGANVPSIAEFKRQFGADLVPTPQVRLVTHPALRLGDRLLGR